MLNISFLACTKVKLWDLTVCIAVNGEKFQSHTVTLTFVRQCPISYLSKIFHNYTTMYSNFMFLDQLLFKLSCKTHTHGNTHTHTHTHTQTHTHTHTHTFRCTQRISIAAVIAKM